MAQRFLTFVLALWLSGMLAACGSAVPSGQPAPTLSGVVVTLRVADTEAYRIRLTNPDDIAIAQKLLVGAVAPRIPNGRVVRGDPDVNVGYSWHIDPASVEFADTTTEVCDGRPSDVEKGTITSEWYCPWSAHVVAIAPAVSRSLRTKGCTLLPGRAARILLCGGTDGQASNLPRFIRKAGEIAAGVDAWS